MIKRLAALILVLLLSIESFAAVVSDNDGSAFITKAEFDSLKNNFQSQIDQYNKSIDSKIDGAIANYLAGIKVAKTDLKSFEIGAGEALVVINEKNVSDLSWGLADLDYNIFFNNMSNSDPRMSWFCLLLQMKRNVSDASFEIFKINNSENAFVSYSYGDRLSLTSAFTFIGKAGLAPFYTQPTNYYFRWHGQPWRHTVLNNDYAGDYFYGNEAVGSSGSWGYHMDKPFYPGFFKFYGTQFNAGAWQNIVNSGFAWNTFSSTLVEGNVVKWIMTSSNEQSKIWTLDFTTKKGQQQVRAAKCDNYRGTWTGTDGGTRKIQCTVPSDAGITTTMTGQLTGDGTDGNTYWNISNKTVYWTDTGRFNSDSCTDTADDWYEYTFENQRLYGKQLYNSNVNSSIIDVYKKYNYYGYLDQGLPIGEMKGDSVVEFEIDTTSYQNDIIIGISTSPFYSGDDVQQNIEDFDLPSDVDYGWEIDGVKQTKLGAKISPAKHNIKVINNWDDGETKALFWKLACPKTATKSPRYIIIIPKEYKLTSH